MTSAATTTTTTATSATTATIAAEPITPGRCGLRGGVFAAFAVGTTGIDSIGMHSLASSYALNKRLINRILYIIYLCF